MSITRYEVLRWIITFIILAGELKSQFATELILKKVSFGELGTATMVFCIFYAFAKALVAYTILKVAVNIENSRLIKG